MRSVMLVLGRRFADRMETNRPVIADRARRP
jgi:hypothetical protein